MATHLAAHEFVVGAAQRTQQTQARPRAAQPCIPASPAVLGPHATDNAAAYSRPCRRSVSCSALSPGDFTTQVIANSAATQQQSGHDSLLQTATGTAWEYLESVLSSSGATGAGSPLNAIAATAKSFPSIRPSIGEGISVISDSISAATNAVSDASPQEAWQLLNSVSGAAVSAWSSLQQSLNIQGVPDLLAASPGLSGSSPSWGGPPVDLQAAVSSMALMNGTFSEPETVAIVCTSSAVIALATLTAAVSESPFVTNTASDSELPSEYDRDAIYDYWTQQPVTMLQRSMETAVRFSGFLIGRQLDKITGREQENEKLRARMLREAVDSLGPAYIKVAQALSTRADLLSPAYYQEITLLQDQVKPFPTEEAMAILEQELGRPHTEVFSTITSKPVAAASLGQVYRATLSSCGADVAVKVQRPGVLELVALDLVIGRKGIEIAGALFPDIRSEQIIPVLDEWAFKLYREMDYRRERDVMQQFAADLSDLSGIVVPEAYSEATTRRVLCTQWIQGEKLSESNAGDVRQLCTTLLNAYLIQLLDTGLLHADPHPGNLIRTPDGKICILDYGLVTEVPANFRVYILEYMAHLSLRDWKAVGNDFVNLQFVAPGSMHPNDIPGLMDAVGGVLEVLMLGGGAKNLENIRDKNLLDNVGLDPGEMDNAGFMDGFATVLDNLSNPDQAGGDGKSEKDRERRAKIKMLREQIQFQLPPYFVLILRAFSVIEGIALKVDPEYSIITETFPYLSRRLLTDNNEEIRKALRQVLYGDGKRMDIDRFRTLFDSLGKYSTDGLPTGGAPAAEVAPRGGSAPGMPGVPAPQPTLNGAGSGGPGLDKNVVLALQSVFNTSGKSYVQELLVEELAATLDSLSRGAAVTLLQRSLSSSLSTATLSLINSLGPLRRMLFPFPLPVEIISHFGNVVTLTEEDHIAIRNVEVLWGVMRPQVESPVGGQQQLSMVQLQLSLLRSFATSVQELPSETREQLVAGMGRTSQMVLQQLTQRTVSRFAQDVASVRQRTGTMADILGSTTAAQPQKVTSAAD